MSVIDVKVPDIGDFKDVPIIEVHVKPGDAVKRDDPLITLESDKAAMEVPAPEAGEVAEILVKVGDKVSEGSPILRISATGAAKAASSASAAETSVPPKATANKAPATSQTPAVADIAPERTGPSPRVPLPPAVDFGGVHASPSVRRLARELDIDYAVCAVAVNHAAGRSPDGSRPLQEIERFTDIGLRKVRAVLQRMFSGGGGAV